MWESTRSIVKHRLFMLICAMAIVAFAFTAKPPSVGACPSQETDIFYYTDNTYSTMCGYKIITCNCRIVQSGCVTSFSYTETWDC
ncbi:MAG TPA: hypothetical protein VOA87_09620 [Thermoanaerobaculia bacterium]|nr:hypothetical protein [Thermoanaerobaculia bacterium]